jgi:hypothetical protein
MDDTMDEHEQLFLLNNKRDYHRVGSRVGTGADHVRVLYYYSVERMRVNQSAKYFNDSEFK